VLIAITLDTTLRGTDKILSRYYCLDAVGVRMHCPWLCEEVDAPTAQPRCLNSSKNSNEVTDRQLRAPQTCPPQSLEPPVRSTTD
jgi:hypothetical protein